MLPRAGGLFDQDPTELWRLEKVYEIQQEIERVRQQREEGRRKLKEQG